VTEHNALPPDIEALLESERQCPNAPMEIEDRVLARFQAPAPAAAPSPATLPWAKGLLVIAAVGGVGLMLGQLSKSRDAATDEAEIALAPRAASPVVLPAALPAEAAPAMVSPNPPTRIGKRSAPAKHPEVVKAVPTAGGAPHSKPSPPEVVEAQPPAAAIADIQPSAGSPSLRQEDALDRELFLIDTARQALGGGDLRGALEHLNQHAREFAQGQLAEERDSLRISCLTKAGDRSAAREALGAFGQRFPRSIHLNALTAEVDAMEPSRTR
jgi:hypothetical protein